ncbi:MAG TPA: lipase maturation factor family protein [Candidatus Krumholzibacteria bacterium]
MTPRPLMLFDSDCGFCRRWIARWQHTTGDRVDYEAYQDACARYPEIPRENFARAVHLIEPDGSHSSGAEAVFRALAHGGRGWPIACYENVPLFRSLSEGLYGIVARHRNGAASVTRMLYGNHVVPPGERRTVALFLRAMGVVFAIAFLSLWVQIIALVGENGVLPAGEHLQAVRENVGPIRYWFLPTVLWLNAGNVALHVVCGAGLACSLAAVAGFVPAASLLGAWAMYLSLLGVGQNFLRFQWDTLLLEAGMVAVLLAPWRLRLRDAGPPSRAALWLARWLIFRLMVTSALVKLTSGDPTWRSLTALEYHYFTQPLPTWTAWYMHQLPDWFHRLTTACMFVGEGIAPFLIFTPRRVRFTGAAVMVALQAGILATGNFGFFNLLTIALCIPLLDDGLWSRTPDAGNAIACGVPGSGDARPAALPAADRPPATSRLRSVAVLAAFVLTLVPFSAVLRHDIRRIGPIDTFYSALEPFRLANQYGLFAVMTTDRPEIVIEGSRDGVEWKAYEFRYKPGDPMRAPRFATPHMPRCDWLMWFAAMGSVRENRWFLVLCWRLLQGTPEARRFFSYDPFPGEPPRYIRATVYKYEFTTRDARSQTHAWWTRSPRGPYVRTLMLRDGVLTTAPAMSGS